jgi:hypothetical protein
MNVINLSWFHFHHPVPCPPGMMITSCSCSNEWNWGNSCVRFNFGKSQTLKKFLVKFQIEKDILTVMICTWGWEKTRECFKYAPTFCLTCRYFVKINASYYTSWQLLLRVLLPFNRPEQVDLYDKIQTGNNNVRSMEHQAVKPGWLHGANCVRNKKAQKKMFLNVKRSLHRSPSHTKPLIFKDLWLQPWCYRFEHENNNSLDIWL